jgi:hypothetical protein
MNAAFLSKIPMGRFCKPEEVAAMIAFLLATTSPLQQGRFSISVEGGPPTDRGRRLKPYLRLLDAALADQALHPRQSYGLGLGYAQSPSPALPGPTTNLPSVSNVRKVHGHGSQSAK